LFALIEEGGDVHLCGNICQSGSIIGRFAHLERVVVGRLLYIRINKESTYRTLLSEAFHFFTS
jgi:diaminopimelate decarboxylase